MAALMVGAVSLLLGGCLASEPPAGSAGEELGGRDRSTPTACSPDRFLVEPGDSVTILSCCQDGPRTFHTSVTPTGKRRLWFRTYNDLPCREEDGVGTNCGVGSDPLQPCYYGPCGAHTPWRVEGAGAYVFEPDSDSGKCGWQAEGVESCITDDDGEGCGRWLTDVRYQPEPYTDQPLYPPVIGTCVYNRCRAGGIPVP